MKRSLSKRLAAIILAFFASASALWGCAPSARKHTETWFDYFDTVITLTAYTDDDGLFERAAGIAGAVFERCHNLFDIYNEHEEGVKGLAAVNSSAGEPVKMPEEVADLVSLCKTLSEETGGSFNIALGPVLRLWHECRVAAENGDEARLPGDEELKEAARHCDISLVSVDPYAGTVTLADPGMSLDAGAVAKGFAADLAAAHLKEFGFPFLLNCGGAVLTYGKKPGGGEWKVGVNDPAGSGYALTLGIEDAALSTSGAYLRRFTLDGVDYGHIIDPVTLYPANLSNGAEGSKVASVSVLYSGPNCAAVADALSTACFILGVERGSELAAKFGAHAVFILENGSMIESP